MTQKIGYKADLDLYMCTTEVWANTCPSADTLYLGEHKTETLYNEVTHTITIGEYQAGIDPVDILFGSWIRCAQKLTPGGENGSWGGCAWAVVDVATLFAGKIIRPIADAVRAMDGAARTGIGFIDAWKALSALRLSDAAMAGIAGKMAEKFYAACRKVSRVASVAPKSRAAAVAPMGTIGSPVPEYSCVGLIAYNSTELSNMAYRARIESGFGVFGNRNVAVAKVPGWNDPKTGDFVIGFSKGAGSTQRMTSSLSWPRRMSRRNRSTRSIPSGNHAPCADPIWRTSSRRAQRSRGPCSGDRSDRSTGRSRRFWRA